jgi:hypothetical protein
LCCLKWRTVRAQDQRSIKIASGRYPDAAATPATVGLLERPHDCILLGAVASEMPRLVIGAAHRVIANQPMAQG